MGINFNDTLNTNKPEKSRDTYPSKLVQKYGKKLSKIKVPINPNYPAAYKNTLPLLSKINLSEFKHAMKKGRSMESGASPIKPLEPTLEFKDKSGRTVKYIDTPSGGISVQWFLLESDNLRSFKRMMHAYLQKHRLLPPNIKYDLTEFRALHSLNLYLPAQKFPLGFKSHLQKKVLSLFKGR